MSFIKEIIFAIWDIFKKGGKHAQLIAYAFLLLAAVFSTYAAIKLAPVIQSFRDYDSRLVAAERATQSNATACEGISNKHFEDMEKIDGKLEVININVGYICGALGIVCK